MLIGPYIYEISVEEIATSPPLQAAPRNDIFESTSQQLDNLKSAPAWKSWGRFYFLKVLTAASAVSNTSAKRMTVSRKVSKFVKIF